MKLKENFSVAEAADYLGLSISYLNKLRSVGGGPRYAKIGRRIIYNVDNLSNWLSAHGKSSTSDQNRM